MANDESTGQFIPYYTFAPENFRKIINRQIQNAVTQAEDNIMKFSIKGDADGRYASSLPVEDISVQDEKGYFYFVVGFSRIGGPEIIAP